MECRRTLGGWCAGFIILSALMVAAGSLATAAACQKISVEGAGYSAANGVYGAGGESYGHTIYTFSDYRIVWQGSWYISDLYGHTYYYNDSASSEPPADRWISYSGYAPAPTLSCADTPPAPPHVPAPAVVGISYAQESETLTLVYGNVGDASATISRLYAGPALSTPADDGLTYFWIPDSDLWQTILLDETYVVAPGETLTLTLPMIKLPDGWLEQAGARALLFSDLAFDAPHIAVGADATPISWIHLVPEWLEMREQGG